LNINSYLYNVISIPIEIDSQKPTFTILFYLNIVCKHRDHIIKKKKKHRDNKYKMQKMHLHAKYCIKFLNTIEAIQFCTINRAWILC